MKTSLFPSHRAGHGSRILSPRTNIGSQVGGVIVVRKTVESASESAEPELFALLDRLADLFLQVRQKIRQLLLDHVG